METQRCDSPLLRWNLSKFVVLKPFGWESLHLEPSCCLEVVVYMLKCVFWQDILLEIALNVGLKTAMFSGITMSAAPTSDNEKKTETGRI